MTKIKTGRMIAFTFSLALILTLFPCSSFAVDVGDEMDFSSDWKGNAVQFTGEDGFKGCCAQAGIERDPEGRATVLSKKGPSSDTAKVVWYIIQNDLMNSSDVADGFDLLKEADLGMKLVQISIQTKDTWWSNIGGMSTDTRDKIYDLYDSIVAGDNAPSSLEILYMDPGNATQHFVLWKYIPNGKLKLKKSSANTGITG